ncbi:MULTISPECIES: S41 family peptidase [unclassified Blautia]|uniref:S41 family peptidase n=1 Tax=unclassified Blautia TaxID=2648079 RepID=UPI000B38991E|nr:MULTISPECIES: S41 family peptidase [unclassified Blautia]OUN30573.1 carboxy- processing protease [Blautia sp. An81]OUN92517.1 carboxy- processing protease [Blautia sp. An46]
MEQGRFRKGFILGIVCTLIIGGGGLKIYDVVQSNERNQGAVTDSFVQKAKYIEETVKESYTGDIDDEQMEEYMYKGMMASLGDPYSAYYTSEEYEELTTETTGSYEGIGVVMQQDVNTGEVKVVRCYEGAPGEKAGLLPEDVLVEVNGESVSGMELSEVVDKVKSSQDQVAHLTIAREGESEYLEIDVHLEEVNIPVVQSEMLEDNIGYIALYEFTEQTEPQYMEAFEALKDQGMERLIIDVRNNPGGLLTSVCDILEDILPEGLIVYTEDKNGEREEYTCDGENELDIPLAVLVNGNSASASEIFAGAIQDYSKGTIVGTTTFGKGIVQSLIPFNDGSAIKTTTAKYYTPSGKCIHGTGIQPDVEVELSEGLEQETSISHEEDNQLQKAIEVVKGSEAG